MNEPLNLRPIESLVLGFDPESSAKADPEKVWRAREAEQAHGFRDTAFFLGSKCVFFVFCLWVVLICVTWPIPGMDTHALLFIGAKVMLVTVVLLTLAISLMRFAIRCAHHDDKVQEEIPSPSSSVEEIVKTVAKSINSPASN